jgi:hypothetical protein
MMEPSDIPGIAPYYDGVVLKLAKCGGITRVLEDRGLQGHGLRLMPGCMIVSSSAASRRASPWRRSSSGRIDDICSSRRPLEGLVLTKGKWAARGSGWASPGRPGEALLGDRGCTLCRGSAGARRPRGIRPRGRARIGF